MCRGPGAREGLTCSKNNTAGRGGQGRAGAGRGGLGQEELVRRAKALHSILSVKKPLEARVQGAGSPYVGGFFWRLKGAWTAGRGQEEKQEHP